MRANLDVAVSREAEPNADHLYIWPQRSLGDKGRKLLLSAVSLAFAALAIWSVRAGIWPVLVYIGFALGGFAWALISNTRKACLVEHIELLPDRIRISRSGPAAREGVIAEFNPCWLRIVDVPGPWGETRLALRESGRAIFIGECLTQDERIGLANELRERIARRYF